jgi:type IV pilus assembly protein PilN
MRIYLNLATRPYADLRPALKRLRIAMAVLVVIGLGLCLGLHAFHRKAEEARATEQRVQSQIDAINKERQGYEDLMHQPANAQLLASTGMLNQIFDVKTFSWTLAMEDLETVLPGGVQVTSIEPVRNTKDGSITLHLRVVGPRDRAVDLVQNLERSKHFLQPRIVGESSESTGGPNERLEPISASNRVNFELLAEYSSTAPMERKAQNKQEGEKPSADGERETQGAFSAHAAQTPAPAGKKFTRQPSTDPGRSKPNPSRGPNPNPNSGGPR